MSVKVRSRKPGAYVHRYTNYAGEIVIAITIKMYTQKDNLQLQLNRKLIPGIWKCPKPRPLTRWENRPQINYFSIC